MRLPAPPPTAHLVTAALCVGFVVPLAVRPERTALAGTAVVLGAVAVLTRSARAPALAAALVATGAWWGTARLDHLDRSVLAAAIGTTALARVEVIGPARLSEFTTRLPVRVRRFDRGPLVEPAQLELPATERAPPQGAILELVARVESPREREEGSSFDEAEYLRRRGIHVVLEAPVYRIVGTRGGIAGAADRVRARLAASIAPGLHGERRALVAGVVLGEDEGLDKALRDNFRSSGLYHLLAVSGQNVAYVVAGVLVAAWLLGVSRAIAHVAAVAAIVLYVAAVGWQPSVVRAGVAGALASLAWLASRPRDRWYFLLVGAAVLLAWSPYSLLDPGFQLSFAAVGAIFLIVPRVGRLLEGYPIPRPLAMVVAVSAACGVATAPIVWLQFGSIPVLSVVANAMAAPVVAPILGLGLVAAALGAVLPSAAFAVGWVNGWLAAYLAWCARTVGGLPFAQIGSWAALLGVLAAAGVAVGVRRAPQHLRRPIAVALAAAALVATGWKLWPEGPALPPPRGLRISILDVGQGDSILLQVPEGAVLVDEGPPEARVYDQLRGLGVGRLTAVVLTHPQRDHIGGAADVIRTIRIGTILDPRQPNPSPYADDAMDAAADRNVPVVAARTGQMFRVGQLRLRVLWPESPGALGQDPNDRAVVIVASFGAVDALLTADAESNVTGTLPLAPVEILKVAHHGSADDGLPALLAELDPKIAVISVGAGNDYGHPAPATLAALAASQPGGVYRTDRDGTVVIETDGRTITVETSR